MAIEAQNISVIVKFEKVNKSFPGGWTEFKKILPKETSCTDGEIVSAQFKKSKEAKAFINKLILYGFVWTTNKESKDIVVVDEKTGPTTKCNWLLFGKVQTGKTQKLAVLHNPTNEAKLFFPTSSKSS
jgi:hypothetical protein